MVGSGEQGPPITTAGNVGSKVGAGRSGECQAGIAHRCCQLRRQRWWGVRAAMVVSNPREGICPTPIPPLHVAYGPPHFEGTSGDRFSVATPL